MKLAEVLLEKKNLASRISDLHERYTAAAVIEADSEPDETAEELLQSLVGAFDQWEDLTVSINLANNRIHVPIGEGTVADMTMMEALAHRDSLKSQIAHYQGIGNSIRQRNQTRRFYSETGPKMVIAEGVNAKLFIKLVDDLGKELRLLDVAIQAANWANEVVE